jgi:hypothetical protein
VTRCAESLQEFFLPLKPTTMSGQHATVYKRTESEVSSGSMPRALGRVDAGKLTNYAGLKPWLRETINCAKRTMVKLGVATLLWTMVRSQRPPAPLLSHQRRPHVHRCLRCVRGVLNLRSEIDEGRGHLQDVQRPHASVHPRLQNLECSPNTRAPAPRQKKLLDKTTV